MGRFSRGQCYWLVVSPKESRDAPDSLGEGLMIRHLGTLPNSSADLLAPAKILNLDRENGGASKAVKAVIWSAPSIYFYSCALCFLVITTVPIAREVRVGTLL